MKECTACGATNAPVRVTCARCDGALAGRSSREQDARDDALLRDAEGALRVKRLRRLHAAVGAMTFFAINLLLGLPHSLLPIQLCENAVVSAVFGLPIGWLISRRRGGALQGALISAAAFVGVRLLIGLLDGLGPAAYVQAFVWGFCGLLPGALIGIHVEMDE